MPLDVDAVFVPSARYDDLPTPQSVVRTTESYKRIVCGARQTLVSGTVTNYTSLSWRHNFAGIIIRNEHDSGNLYVAIDEDASTTNGLLVKAGESYPLPVSPTDRLSLVADDAVIVHVVGVL